MRFLKFSVIFYLVSCGQNQNDSSLSTVASSSFVIVPTHSAISNDCSSEISTSYASNGAALSAQAACVAKLPDSFGSDNSCAVFPDTCMKILKMGIPPGTKIPNEFSEKADAEKDAGCQGKKWNDQKDPSVTNKHITDAYARQYLSNPDVFKWSGLAALASNTVGVGLKVPNDALKSFLSQGNQAVFNDIHWQQRVYADKKLDGLKFFKETGALNSARYNAWEKIDSGHRAKDQLQVWEGNNELLRIEQKDTLQPLYDKYKDKLKGVSFVAYSPVPGSFSPFQSTNPGGDITEFEQRWTWIQKSILPDWKKLEATDSEKIKKEFEEMAKNKKDSCK